MARAVDASSWIIGQVGTLSAGQELSHFRVLAPLGAGGMGEVYLAEDLRLGRKVALKVLSREFTTHHDRVRRFRQEARTISGLNHPNILTVYDVGEVHDLHFIATEYVDGETLRSRMVARPVEVAEALDIAVQIARALSAAHAAGIVHRDLKPENVMLRRDGYTKVLDFGLAKLRDSGIGLGAEPESPTGIVETMPGVILGTFNYMSPEQARGRDVDQRSDLFSLGVIMYEMLSGRLPFGGETVADILARLIHDEPATVSSVGSAPSVLDPVVARLLRKPPDQRYPTADDLITDLKSVERELERVRERGLSHASAEGQAIPVEGERSEAAGVASGRTAHKRRSKRSVDSVAVLPLENLSRDETLDYLTDGLTESLINSLSALPRLKVMARSTVFRYKGREIDPQNIGNDLGVRAVLTGRVLRREDSLTIGAELVDVSDGSQIWGGQFTRRPSDLFSIQEEISREITEHLKVRLTPAERQRLGRTRSVSATAYELYLKGRYYLNQRSPGALQKARELFEESIASDPAYALSYTGLADSYAISAGMLSGAVAGQYALEQTVQKARAAANRAIQLDEAVAEAHASLAYVKYRFDWDWAGAELEFKRAVDLNPGHAQTRHWFGMYLASRGRLDRAREEMQRARELDPLSSVVQSGIGRIHHFAGRYQEALDLFRQILKADPSFVGTHFDLTLTLLAMGEVSEAEAQLDQLAQIMPETATMVMMRGIAAQLADRRADAERALASLTSRYEKKASLAQELAVLSAWLGNEQALTWLKRACEERAAALTYVGVEPLLAPLANDPASRELLRQYDLLKES